MRCGGTGRKRHAAWFCPAFGLDGAHGRRIWRYRQKYPTIDGLRENTVNAALRRMGYSTKENITGHGFRATARTILDERQGNVLPLRAHSG